MIWTIGREAALCGPLALANILVVVAVDKILAETAVTEPLVSNHVIGLQYKLYNFININL